MTTDLSRPSILLALQHRETLLGHLRGGDTPVLFVPGDHCVTPGTEVEIEIEFSEPAVTLSSRGVVRWNRMRGFGRLSAGAGIQFSPSEFDTVRLMKRFARGEWVPMLKRRSRRLAATLPVEFDVDGLLVSAATGNISLTGAFIVTAQSVSPPQVLALHFPDRSVALKGQVCRVHRGRRGGVGVRFVPKSGDCEGLEHMVTQLRTSEPS